MCSGELNIKPDETELNYIRRIGDLKNSGLIDMTWRELADVFNENLRVDNPYTESAYRKKFANIRRFLNENDNVVVCEDAEDLVKLRRELEKEKIKFRDERNEYNRLIREEARKESYREQFIRSIEEAAGKHSLQYTQSNQKSFVRGNAVIVAPLTDLHCGMKVSNHWNTYNENILKNMLNRYIDKIICVAINHGAEDIVVVGSELVSGQIHPTIKIQNNQDMIDQFLTVTDYICDFLKVLSGKFNNVSFYVAPGNHGRIHPSKDENLNHENFDNLVIPFVRSKLQNYRNIKCCENTITDDIVTCKINNIDFVAVHGDKDTPENVAKNMTKMLGYAPGIILMGHKHFNSYTTDGFTKVIQSGSFVGSDEYAITHRLVGYPEQTLLVINDGLECVYDVRFEPKLD